MDDCLFCKIIAGKIPTKKVYDGDLIEMIRGYLQLRRKEQRE